jgi:hypothetical protein
MLGHASRLVVSFSVVAIAVSCGGQGTDTGQSSGSSACQGGDCTLSADGVGDACTPADEANADFAGYATTEVNSLDHAPDCRTAICIAANFQGRVSCPYGGPACTTPAGAPVTASVKPQLVARAPSDAVYCSCRCDGPAGTGAFCACPTGFECAPLIQDIGVGQRNLVGSYCIKSGTAVSDPHALQSGPTCDAAAHNCDDR